MERIEEGLEGNKTQVVVNIDRDLLGLIEKLHDEAFSSISLSQQIELHLATRIMQLITSSDFEVSFKKKAR